MKTTPAPRSTSKPSPTVTTGSVTLEQVAREAGVSSATVSRILNGTATVSPVKKKIVDAAIAKLGFVPNPVARGLAGGRTFSIGVVTQSLDSPFYGAALRGIEETLLPLGYCPLFVSGQWQPDVESRCMDVLKSRRVDGIIVLTGRMTDKELKNHAKALPIVVTGRDIAAKNLLGLYFDNVEGARLATQHLIDLGHRHIACISGDTQHPDAVERLQGYRMALHNAGIAYEPALVLEGGFLELGGLQAIQTLLAARQRFTAVFAANDQMALGAVLGLHRHALRVPEDVSVIGFDDLPASLYANPPLSTVCHPAYDMGRLSALAILQLLGGQTPDAQVPAPKVVSRESCRRLAH